MDVIDAPRPRLAARAQIAGNVGRDAIAYLPCERRRVGSPRVPVNLSGSGGGVGSVSVSSASELDVEVLSPETQAALLSAVALHADRQAFARLYAYFAPRVRAFLMRSGSDPVAAEELVQDAMMSVWRRADSFDSAQASAATWIFTIARNRRIDVFRRGNRPALDPDDPALVPAAEQAPDDHVEAVEQTARIAAAIKSLPEAQASLLRMAFYEDKAHSEIADETGLPLGTVKSRLRLAIGKMRTSLGVE